MSEVKDWIMKQIDNKASEIEKWCNIKARLDKETLEAMAKISDLKNDKQDLELALEKLGGKDESSV
jgi:hypothetical protein